MLAESTGLSYKTVQRVMEHLEILGLVKHTRRVGNARAYAFQVERLRDFLRSAQDLTFNLEQKEETLTTTREEEGGEDHLNQYVNPPSYQVKEKSSFWLLL